MNGFRTVAVAAVAVAVTVLGGGCAAQPMASPGTAGPSTPGEPAANASPTPCTDPLDCSVIPPFRTLPPIPTATPNPDATARSTVTPGDSFRIATGSCLLYAPGGTALADIALQQPDLMLWLGDNVYADTTEMHALRATYDLLAANPRFQQLSAVTETMAVWDDHDYGFDNANGTHPAKEGSKAEFLRFWGAGSDDPRWTQPGVYSARTFGTGDRAVQVILLDNRYNLDPWDYEGLDPARQVLGEVQWAWLRDRLLEPAAIRIIGSGIQVVQDYDIDTAWEGWGDSPLQRRRLFELIRELGVPGVIFVSGDMHFAELSLAAPADGIGYPTWDLTGSGLDRPETIGEGLWNNPFRVGGLLNSARKHGMVEIDWSPSDPEIHLEIWDGRDLFLDQVVRLSELQPASSG